MLLTILSFAAPLLISCLALATLHWFPWHNGTRPLNRLSAYTLGVGVVVGVPVVTMLLAADAAFTPSPLYWAGLLVANAAVSGTTVRVAYWIDSHRAITVEDAYAAERR